MSHHANDIQQQEEMARVMKDLMGEFPDGRIRDNDMGAVPVAIGHDQGRVTMQFPKNLNWIGFTADQAIDIANALIEHARTAGSRKPLTVKIG